MVISRLLNDQDHPVHSRSVSARVREVESVVLFESEPVMDTLQFIFTEVIVATVSEP